MSGSYLGYGTPHLPALRLRLEGWRDSYAWGLAGEPVCIGACSGEVVMRTRYPGLGWRLDAKYMCVLGAAPEAPGPLVWDAREWLGGQDPGVPVSGFFPELSFGLPLESWGCLWSNLALGTDGRKEVLIQDSGEQIHPGVMESEGGDGD